MKYLAMILAAGTAYYVTSRVYITGLSDWGAVPPGFHANDYTVSGQYSDLVGVTLGGDPEFSLDASTCPGARSCTATVSFMADLGGDYTATISGRSANVAPRIRGSVASKIINVHVIGADYTLVGIDNGNSTATFTLDSTGEEDLVGLSFAASALNGDAAITGGDCGETVPVGVSCTVLVTFSLPPDGFATYGYVFLQAFGSTRQQDPARVTLVLPLPSDRALLDGPTPIIVDGPTPIIVDGPTPIIVDGLVR